MYNRLPRIYPLIFILLASIIFSGCKREIPVFNVAISDSIRTLDPQYATTNAEKTVIANIFAHLARYNKDGELTLYAADSYTVSPDKLTHTFTIKKNLYWQNSEPVTAHDYVYAIERIYGGSPYAAALKGFGIIAAARNDHTLELRLSKPTADIRHIFAESYTAPCNRDFLISTKGKYGLTLETTPSCGAYKLNSRGTADIRHIFAESYTAPCNRDFLISTKGKYGLTLETTPSCGAYKLNSRGESHATLWGNTEDNRDSRIKISTGTAYSVNTQLELFNSEKLDIIYVDETAVKGIKKPAEAAITTLENTVSVLAFNTESSVFSNPQLRRAFIPSARVAKEAEGKLLPKGIGEGERLFNPTELSIEEFRKILAELSLTELPAVKFITTDTYKSLATDYAKDKNNTFGTLISPQVLTAEDFNTALESGSAVKFITTDTYKSLATDYAKDKNNTFGTLISPQVLTAEDFNTALESGSFDIAIYTLTGSSNDTLGFLSYFLQGNPKNYTKISNESFNTAIEEKDTATAQRLLAENYYLYPIDYPKEYIVARKSLGEFIQRAGVY